MNRYDVADSLEGRPGFDRSRFLIAGAARSFLDLGEAMKWNPAGVAKCRSEAMRRFSRLRAMRRAEASKADGNEEDAS